MQASFQPAVPPAQSPSASLFDAFSDFGSPAAVLASASTPALPTVAAAPVSDDPFAVLSGGPPPDEYLAHQACLIWCSQPFGVPPKPCITAAFPQLDCCSPCAVDRKPASLADMVLGSPPASKQAMLGNPFGTPPTISLTATAVPAPLPEAMFSAPTGPVLGADYGALQVRGLNSRHGH